MSDDVIERIVRAIDHQTVRNVFDNEAIAHAAVRVLLEDMRRMRHLDTILPRPAWERTIDDYARDRCGIELEPGDRP